MTLIGRIRRERMRRDSGQTCDNAALAALVALMRRTVPASPDLEDDARQAGEALGGYWARPEKIQRYHESQAAAWTSKARFRAIEAGRRSGKSEHRRREALIDALSHPGFVVVIGAPTQQQVIDLHWDDVLAMTPSEVVKQVSISTREVRLVNGSKIRLAGLDRPQRVEGFPIDRLYLDEYADMKPEAWTSHLRPSLSTPGRVPGRATFFGTPDMKSGRHFVDLCDQFVADAESGEDCGYHHWSSQGIVDEAEWEQARRTMTEAEFAVEYRAERTTTGNRAYYEFRRGDHVRELRLVAGRSVAMCLDFNVEPGVASLVQEQTREDYPDRDDWPEGIGDAFTAIVDEVWIPLQSNTPAVVRAVLAKLDGHKGIIEVHGDATGGARGTAQVEGSDWDIVRRMLRGAVGQGGFRFCVPHRNPPERSRVNTVNRRLRTADGKIHLLVAPRCRHMIDDLERVSLLKGGTGELHKPGKGPGAELSHMSDSVGYLLESRYGAAGSMVEFGFVG
jgi:hypothetical protein